MASVKALVARMKDLASQNNVPSNVSDLLKEAAETLTNQDKELSIRANTASSLLDQVSNDPNIKQHTRTEIWNLASKVESLEDN